MVFLDIQQDMPGQDNRSDKVFVDTKTDTSLQDSS